MPPRKRMKVAEMASGDATPAPLKKSGMSRSCLSGLPFPNVLLVSDEKEVEQVGKISAVSSNPEGSVRGGKHSTAVTTHLTTCTYQIAKHLSPGDLLQLARCSRPFREMLMSKTSKHIWKVAREAHGVPNCPDDLSEPRFADLLFGKGCSVSSLQ